MRGAHVIGVIKVSLGDGTVASWWRWRCNCGAWGRRLQRQRTVARRLGKLHEVRYNGGDR